MRDFRAGRFKRLKNEIFHSFISPASSELASDRTVFGSASSCAPLFKNTVPCFLLGDHPVYQQSSRLRPARTLTWLYSRCNWYAWQLVRDDVVDGRRVEFPGACDRSVNFLHARGCLQWLHQPTRDLKFLLYRWGKSARCEHCTVVGVLKLRVTMHMLLKLEPNACYV